ncbi:hypothetical protein B0J17DRAFT_719088 [Rhizoctonia solani]|nr:hypothetical protein B0J17DRAFT_719088 [Rhizoctonia solani]
MSQMMVCIMFSPMLTVQPGSPSLYKAGKASLDVPPDELRITDRPVKPHGASGPHSVGPSTVPVATGMLGDPAAFGVALASFIQHTTGLGKVLPPSQPAPTATASREDTNSMDDLAADPEFPYIRDWLASVQDTHPRLMDYADTLEERQLTHLNQLDSHNMSVAALVSIGMGFLDASAFLRLGQKASKEFREIFKK